MAFAKKLKNKIIIPEIVSMLNDETGVQRASILQSVFPVAAALKAESEHLVSERINNRLKLHSNNNQEVDNIINIDTKKAKVKSNKKISNIIAMNTHKIKLTDINQIEVHKDYKADNNLLNYYSEISGYIIPYLRERPLCLQLKPYIAFRKNLYSDDITSMPEFIKIFTTRHVISLTGKRDIAEYLVCNNKQTLQYALNLGCVDFNPWNSKITSSELPDYTVININTNGSPFTSVIQTALAFKDILETINIKSFPKTSGKKGIHIYIPLNKKFDYPESEIFAGFISHLVHKQLPSITTLENTEEKRGAKVYIDWMQNKKGKALVSAYSVRPYAGYPVSAPLDWSEVNEQLKPEDFNIFTMPERLKEKGDLFKGLLNRHNRIDMGKILEKFNQTKLF
ncbi:MAG: hypothetical protein EHM58_09260 [Ignavibacteriae bacterium]|nr:MAG: hypothetical protein EHM58_09260 [Ignavibacteriota bacterium]